jgi:hypothetical protein
MILTRPVTAALAALATCVAAVAGAGPPPHTSVATCTNTSSGTTWQIDIDFDRATVDANPAQVGAKQITWYDAKDGGNYTLDRTTGDLTFVAASSTGGYMLRHRCTLPP